MLCSKILSQRHKRCILCPFIRPLYPTYSHVITNYPLYLYNPCVPGVQSMVVCHTFADLSLMKIKTDNANVTNATGALLWPNLELMHVVPSGGQNWNQCRVFNLNLPLFWIYTFCSWRNNSSLMKQYSIVSLAPCFWSPIPIADAPKTFNFDSDWDILRHGAYIDPPLLAGQPWSRPPPHHLCRPRIRPSRDLQTGSQALFSPSFSDKLGPLGSWTIARNRPERINRERLREGLGGLGQSVKWTLEVDRTDSVRRERSLLDVQK